MVALQASAHLATRPRSHHACSKRIPRYTEQILKWWETHGTGQRCTIASWAKAATIIFAMSPNSASCERVFSLLKNMFGDKQMSSLADYISAALMLRYNQRTVG